MEKCWGKEWGKNQKSWQEEGRKALDADAHRYPEGQRQESWSLPTLTWWGHHSLTQRHRGNPTVSLALLCVDWLTDHHTASNLWDYKMVAQVVSAPNTLWRDLSALVIRPLEPFWVLTFLSPVHCFPLGSEFQEGGILSALRTSHLTWRPFWAVGWLVVEHMLGAPWHRAWVTCSVAAVLLFLLCPTSAGLWGHSHMASEFNGRVCVLSTRMGSGMPRELVQNHFRMCLQECF